MGNFGDEAKIDPTIVRPVSVLSDFLEGYFNIQYHGVENIPFGDRFVWTHNHCGWPSLDAFVIGKKIFDTNLKENGVAEGGLAFWHDITVRTPGLGRLVQKLGGVSINEISTYSHWDKHSIFATPAEGEEGSFRSSFSKKSQLVPFKAGIGRIACKGKVRYILPVSILGPDESFPVLKATRIPIRKLLKKLESKNGAEAICKTIAKVSKRDVLIPWVMPLQGIPVSWYVRFHPPIDISKLVARADPDIYEKDIYLSIARKAQESIEADLIMQSQIRKKFHIKMPSLTPGSKKALKGRFFDGLDRLESLLLTRFDKEEWAYGASQVRDCEVEDDSNVIPFPKSA